ncbi:MAG: hypothetical protein ABSA09_06045 [Desulfobaccales bacterium]|jgi:hypothetical protein
MKSCRVGKTGGVAPVVRRLSRRAFVRGNLGALALLLPLPWRPEPGRGQLLQGGIMETFP